MAEITSEIGLPRIDHAEVTAARFFTTLRWHLRLRKSGPDRRYRPAVVDLLAKDVRRLIQALRHGKGEVIRLRGLNLSGELYRVIWRGPGAVLAVKGPCLMLRLNSPTQSFGIELDDDDIDKILATLETVEPLGERLLQELRSETQRKRRFRWF